MALRERAELGWLWGLAELAPTLLRQPRQAMPVELWDRFTGLAAARAGVEAHAGALRGARVAVAAPGKGAERVELALREAGVAIAPDERDAEVLVVGTLSPGPAADALQRLRRREAEGAGRPVVALWSPFSAVDGRARAERPQPVQAQCAALHTIGA
ncbi:MAG: hypothetical protein D6824_03910 [Planctomycetota bacterium]|nr:MAG: hypothetical protein D6824_03910 [Planctomycetota bacterium]